MVLRASAVFTGVRVRARSSFDECTMGPNVRVGGDGPKTDSAPFGKGKVVNGIKGAEAVTELLDSVSEA